MRLLTWFRRNKSKNFYTLLIDDFLKRIEELEDKQRARQRRKKRIKNVATVILSYILWYSIYGIIWFLFNYFIIKMTLTQVAGNALFGILLGCVSAGGFLWVYKLVTKKFKLG